MLVLVAPFLLLIRLLRAIGDGIFCLFRLLFGKQLGVPYVHSIRFKYL